METTYTQKLILCVILGLVAAVVIKFYRVFVVDANNSINGGISQRATLPEDKNKAQKPH